MSISVAVAGASGYAGGELLRLLAAHPEFDVRTVTAFSNAGQPLVAVQPHLRSLAHLELRRHEPENLAGHDVVFLALPHGKSGEITAAPARRTRSSSTAAPTTASPTRPTGPRSTAATTSAPGTTGCPSCCSPTAARSATCSSAQTPHRGARMQRHRDHARARARHPRRPRRAARPRRRARRRTVGCGQGAEAPTCSRPRSSAPRRAYGVGGRHRHNPEIRQNLRSRRARTR